MCLGMDNITTGSYIGNHMLCVAVFLYILVK